MHGVSVKLTGFAVDLIQHIPEHMDGEEGGFDPFYDRPRPQRSLNVMLANPRETGAVEFLAAIREGDLDEVSLIKDSCIYKKIISRV